MFQDFLRERKMFWNEKCLLELTHHNLFESTANRDRFRELLDCYWTAPFFSKGICKCMYLASWDDIHFAEILSVLNELTIQGTHSVQLMKDTADMKADAVAAELQKVHTEEYDPRHYNNEQSLRATIKLAFFAYKDEYIQLEELAGGTGYADIVYLPKRNSDYPALDVELKALDKTHPQNDAEGAIAQIKQRNYPDILKNYTNEILLVGISYDKDDPDKKHSCTIESFQE